MQLCGGLLLQHTVAMAFRMQVAAGTNHTVVTCARGVYTFGCNDHGQLGLGSLQDAPVPVRVKQLATNRDKIVQVAAGLAHTLFISESNRVYAAGLCDLGQFKPAPTPSPLAGTSGNSGLSAVGAAGATASVQPGTSPRFLTLPAWLLGQS
jgi:alpha-tubulin suppressor-like RCC1 family protein